MTALTPKQMRELADVLAGYHSWKDVRNGSAALRTAADQLEAVERYVADGEVEDDLGQHVVYTYGLKQILIADTAPGA